MIRPRLLLFTAFALAAPLAAHAQPGPSSSSVTLAASQPETFSMPIPAHNGLSVGYTGVPLMVTGAGTYALASAPFTLTPVWNLQTGRTVAVEIYASDLTDTDGDIIDATNLSISFSGPTVSAGGSGGGSGTNVAFASGATFGATNSTTAKGKRFFTESSTNVRQATGTTYQISISALNLVLASTANAGDYGGTLTIMGKVY